MKKIILLLLGMATLGLSACIAVPLDEGHPRHYGYYEAPPPHCWWEHGERFCR